MGRSMIPEEIVLMAQKMSVGSSELGPAPDFSSSCWMTFRKSRLMMIWLEFCASTVRIPLTVYANCSVPTFALLSELFTYLLRAAYRRQSVPANAAGTLQGWRYLMSCQLQPLVEFVFLPAADTVGRCLGYVSPVLKTTRVWLMVLLHIYWLW